jgi:3',5'-cyclic AMP phosphodiesterase CpdA
MYRPEDQRDPNRGGGVPSLTLAHISDLHIGPLPRPGLRALAGKRVTGFLSWRLKRSKIHRIEVLDVLAKDLAAQQPDHVAVTGDLVNIALPAEFAQAHEFLKRIGPADKVTVVPGNHDAYVALPWIKAAGLWDEYMTGRHADGGDRPPRDVRDFPFVRRVGGMALIGVSTALPTRPFSAAGELGADQLQRLDAMLEQLGDAGAFRIVMIHHPPFGGGAYKRKSLRDAGPLAEIIQKRGCELMLHGHTHMSQLGRMKGPNTSVPVIGVPSASAVMTDHRDPSRYHIYRLSRGEGADGAWSLTVSMRELKPDGSGFQAIGEIVLLGEVNPPASSAAA